VSKRRRSCGLGRSVTALHVAGFHGQLGSGAYDQLTSPSSVSLGYKACLVRAGCPAMLSVLALDSRGLS
jgi:hypothetical protein